MEALAGLAPGPRAWVLNLDAERELERPGAVTPSASLRERVVAMMPRLDALLRPGDLIVDEGTPPGSAAGRAGLAWCPTPHALRLLGRAGATRPPAPPVEVLRRVNHRRFCAALGGMLPGAAFVEALAPLAAIVARPPPVGEAWLLKRPLGFTGRGQLPVSPGALSPSALTWASAALRPGDGLQVEPRVDRLDDFALHAWLAPDGDLTVGQPTRQLCSPLGVWQGTELAGDRLPDDERAALAGALRQTADALTAAGYAGPFNLDAFAWQDGAARRFLPRCEINARFSMGWAIGMGLARD
ncbi:MAG: hypothetical protein EOO75_11405 [Myxococcales bacterium]|nr:MAG: hypothetical protein EOO75_11405 [Myxococcales bacterium]